MNILGILANASEAVKPGLETLDWIVIGIYFLGLVAVVSAKSGCDVPNIMIVEDNANFRRTLKSILSSRFPFHEVNEAESGELALEKFEDHHQDLFLLDIHLPGMSGIEVAKKIKEGHPECKVIILTGYDTPEYREAAFQAGVNGFLSKRKTALTEILDQVESKLERQ